VIRVGDGRTAEVFAWEPGRVVKVLRPGFDDRLGAEEAIAAAAADAAGIGAPRFHGTVRVDGRFGLVYERIDGRSMLETVSGDPTAADELAARLGRLHAAIHSAPGSGLPRLRDALDRAALDGASSVGDAIADTVRSRLARLEDGDAVCHGDLHPGNVILAADEPRVIDWVDAGSGPPAADVARTLFLLRDGLIDPAVAPDARARIASRRHRFADAYLAAYRELRPGDLDAVDAWRLPILAARLTEEVAGERSNLVRLIEADIQRMFAVS
jgi:aminoglycoside phosphotransferase (APT) family kinase protein